MSRSFDLAAVREGLAGLTAQRIARDPRLAIRIGLGSLLAFNLVAAYFVVRPLGGSPEELEQQATTLERQIAQQRGSMGRLTLLRTKTSKAREEGDRFLGSYFMDRRTASSGIIFELNRMAKEAGIRPKDHTFAFEPIEGSDTLSMMVINGNYEGTYADLMHYLNRLDRSPRFIIIDTLSAAPQTANATLSLQMKLYTFVKEGGSPEEAEETLRRASMEPAAGKTDNPTQTAAPQPGPAAMRPVQPTPTVPVPMNPQPQAVQPAAPGAAATDTGPRWQGPPEQDPNNPNYRPLRPGGPRRRVIRPAEDQ